MSDKGSRDHKRGANVDTLLALTVQTLDHENDFFANWKIAKKKVLANFIQINC